MQHSFLNMVPSRMLEDLSGLYLDPAPLIELWNRTQVREPYEIGEIEDLFFSLEDEKGEVP